MRYLLMGAGLVMLAAVQSSILPYFRLYSGQPNLVMLVVAAWAIDSSWEEGAFWAFWGGICMDLLSVVPLGTSVVPLLVATFAIRLAVTQTEGLTLLIYLVVVLAGIIIAQIVLFVVLGLEGYFIEPVPVIRYFAIPSVIYQMLVAAPVYVVVRWLGRTFPARRVL
jgi:rod shape-determining protein MreD